MTRAREELILLTGPEPSPFLDDLPARYVSRETAAPRAPQGGGCAVESILDKEARRHGRRRAFAVFFRVETHRIG